MHAWSKCVGKIIVGSKERQCRQFYRIPSRLKHRRTASTTLRLATRSLSRDTTGVRQRTWRTAHAVGLRVGRFSTYNE